MAAQAPQLASPHLAPAGDRAGNHVANGRKSRVFVRIVRVTAPVVLVAGAIAGIARYRSTHVVAPVHYEVARVDVGPVAAKVTATGALSALVTVSVGSQVSGRIESLYADFGSKVTKGQVVAKIEPSFFRAAVEQASANHGAALAAIDRADAQILQADKQYVRAQSLFAQGLVSKADLETAESALGVARADVKSAKAAASQAKAALDQALLNLKYTTIVSPIDGIVISRNVDVGQTVAAALQAPVLFTIAQDLTRMQVDTNVAEADVGKVQPQMQVTFTVDAYPRQSFGGVVRQVRDNASTVQNVVTYDAVIDVNNTARLLKPGMTANVTFVWATRDSVVRLPNGALRFKPDTATLSTMTKVDAAAAPKPNLAPDERTVWVVRNGHARAAVVRIGVSDGTVTEVIGGELHTGDEVVVEASLTAKGS
ncbi:MAG: efflux RND transporter periplasmic adaptor subunit [Polyangiales bacterium]